MSLILYFNHMLSKSAALLEAFRNQPNWCFSNREIQKLGGFRYSSRLCELRKKGIGIESFKSENKEGLWYYKLIQDNPAIMIDKNGEIKDTSLVIKREAKEAVKKGFWERLFSNITG